MNTQNYKRTFLISVLGAVVLLLTGLQIAQLFFKKEVVVYVNNEKLLDAFDGKKQLQAVYEKDEIRRRGKLDSMVVKLKSYSSNEATAQTVAYKQQVREYQILHEEFERQNKEEQEKYQEQIFTQLNQFVQDYGKQEGYTYILGANGNGTILYANNHKDITEDLIKYINARYHGNN